MAHSSGELMNHKPAVGEGGQGRIWTYSTLSPEYHLVVVFDDKDVVRTHRILKVR